MFIINKINSSRINLFQVIVFIYLIYSSNLLGRSTENQISLDELAWVNDSVVFEHRINNNFEYFEWNSKQPIGGWTSHDFRLFDQPHLVKYIYGASIKNGLNFKWDEITYEKHNSLFLGRSWQDDIYLNTSQSKEELGEITNSAILLNRKVSALFLVSFLFVLFVFLVNISSFFHSILVVVLLLNNRMFFQSLIVGTADSISIFLVLSSLIILYKLFWEIENLSKKRSFILTYLLAIFSSLAVSAKINGWFLVPLVLVFFSFKMMLDEEKNINKRILLDRFILWLIIFTGTYVYLQPELWNNSFEGVIRFFSQRIGQHQRFITAFGSFDLINFFKWILQLFFNSTVLNSTIKNTIFLIVGFFGLFKSVTENYRSHIFGKIMIISVWISSSVFLYARVGFNRYALWLVILLTILLSYGWIKVIKLTMDQLRKLKK